MHKTDAGIVKIPASVLHCLFFERIRFCEKSEANLRAGIGGGRRLAAHVHRLRFCRHVRKICGDYPNSLRVTERINCIFQNLSRSSACPPQ